MTRSAPSPPTPSTNFGIPRRRWRGWRSRRRFWPRPKKRLLRALGFPEGGPRPRPRLRPGLRSRAICQGASRADSRRRRSGLRMCCEKARRGRCRSPGGTADQLPFPAGCASTRSSSRLVLRHVAQPEAALAEMYRVLRPAAARSSSTATTARWCCIRGPPPSRARWRARDHVSARGADPFIGRRLPMLFAGAGFVELALRTLVVDSVTVGRRPFARIVLSPVADAIDRDLLGPRRGRGRATPPSRAGRARRRRSA